MPSQGDKYYSILNYGNNPNVMFNTKTNEFTVFMRTADNNSCPSVIDNVSGQLTAVYSNTDFPLQKWMNIVLNYDGGRLDVFLNSKLVKTSYDVIHCIHYDDLNIGQDGLNARMCNVIYFSKPIDIITIHNMFNLTKITDVPEIPTRNLFDF